MKIAITGCNGSVGKPVVAHMLRHGHTVVGIDARQDEDVTNSDKFTFICADLLEYDRALEALAGCDAVVHLAAMRDPGDYRVKSHNTNVVLSWNVLRACAELNISRVAQASSCNVINLLFCDKPHYDFFPIDETHPCLPDEPYGLSKVICEVQAATIVRRYPSMRIASLRLHWSVPNRSVATECDADKMRRDLWGYLYEDSGAEAFRLAVTEESGRWSGHEAFFITSPRIAFNVDSRELRQKYWPNVPIRAGKDVSGEKGFFDCTKAERLLGWVHRDAVQ